MAVILVVDDDLGTLQTMERALEREQHIVVSVTETAKALAVAHESQPDLIILDVVLSNSDGVSLCAQLRRLPFLSDVPVLFTTAYYCGARDIAYVLDSGGDDFMRKPFSVKELNARVRALLRRTAYQRSRMMPLLTIDSTLRTITLNQRAVSLTAIEFDLLDYLSRHHDRYHTALDLLASVWDYPPGAGDTALVRNHIHNLRHKLENDPDRPRIILSLHGRGYRLNAEVLRNEVVESAMS